MEAARQVKELGKPNDLLDRIAGDPIFRLTREELDKLLDPASFTGLAKQQTERFLSQEVRPVLEKYRDEPDRHVDIRV